MNAFDYILMSFTITLCWIGPWILLWTQLWKDRYELKRWDLIFFPIFATPIFNMLICMAMIGEGRIRFSWFGAFAEWWAKPLFKDRSEKPHRGRGTRC